MSSQPRPGAAQYLEQALFMIDGSGSSRGVNLREVARALGYAHTNAYNYFAGLEDLLSQTLVAALEHQFDSFRRAVSGKGTGWGQLERVIDGQIQFALEHPGWYRFIWLEPLRAPPPTRALELMEKAGDGLIRLVAEVSKGTLSSAEARQVAEDFHTYLHGALCKAIAGRGFDEDVRRKLFLRARRVLRNFIQHVSEE